MRYAAERMFASSALPPTVLRLDGLKTLAVRPNVSGPPELGVPASLRRLHTFNPSLAAAPSGLCPRCTHVVALRADALHQCDASSPLWTREAGTPAVVATNAWFKSTILAALDSEQQVLGWTWLLIAPAAQVSTIAARSRWHVAPGVTDDFAPPWGAMSYDARLINYGGRLFATYLRSCHKAQPCDFGVAQLQLRATPTPNGALTRFQAWALPPASSKAPWAQGRNQALFVVGMRLMVQPWLGLIAAFEEQPAVDRRHVHCYEKRPLSTWQRRQEREICGPTARDSVMALERLRLGELRLLYSRGSGVRGSKVSRDDALDASRDESGHTHSPTANLVRVARISGGKECAAYLGVGHVHRGDGALNRWHHRPSRSARSARASRRRAGRSLPDGGAHVAAAFKFGFDYHHYLYTLAAQAPHQMLGKSEPFCVASEQDPLSCERVQFLSGIALMANGSTLGSSTEEAHLLVSFGVNDCEAKVGRLPLRRLWEMLRPLPGTAAVCSS